MGYQTEFFGAFCITPKLDPTFACRLNLWLNSRHYQRIIGVTIPEHAGDDINDITLFGTPGRHNEFYMPSFKQATANLIQEGINPVLAPHLMGTTYQDNLSDGLSSCPNLTVDCQLAYNSTPENIPSLWSNIILVNDPDQDCSYLGWNQTEKSYKMKTWFNSVIRLLQRLHYEVNGRICAYGEDPDDIWGMEISPQNDLIIFSEPSKEPLYQNEFMAAMEHSLTAAKKQRLNKKFPYTKKGANYT